MGESDHARVFGTARGHHQASPSMAGIFKNIQGLYGLMTKKAAEEILAGASTDSEATQKDRATEEVVKDVALPQQKKRKLTKCGVTVATGSEIAAADKGKKATAAMAVVPVAEG
ncbi:hypothetical protein Dimus_003407 [Dionaea muscipula]